MSEHRKPQANNTGTTTARENLSEALKVLDRVGGPKDEATPLTKLSVAIANLDRAQASWRGITPSPPAKEEPPVTLQDVLKELGASSLDAGREVKGIQSLMRQYDDMNSHRLFLNCMDGRSRSFLERLAHLILLCREVVQSASSLDDLNALVIPLWNSETGAELGNKLSEGIRFDAIPVDEDGVILLVFYTIVTFLEDKTEAFDQEVFDRDPLLSESEPAP